VPAVAPRSRPVALDREAILAAALALVDARGLDGLNMRALAQELGVGTMSLYHHVPNKDALLQGIVEAVLAEIEIPSPDAGPWDERVLLMARSFRLAALRHPHCVPLLVTRTFTTAASLRPCEASFEVLAEAGLDVEQSLIAFRTIVAYVLGFVTMESAGFFGGVGLDQPASELVELGLPRLAAVTSHLTGRDVDADFAKGLRAIEHGAVTALLRRG
jgi:AcrR family transcriptional regulator